MHHQNLIRHWCYHRCHQSPHTPCDSIIGVTRVPTPLVTPSQKSPESHPSLMLSQVSPESPQPLWLHHRHHQNLIRHWCYHRGHQSPPHHLWLHHWCHQSPHTPCGSIAGVTNLWLHHRCHQFVTPSQALPESASSLTLYQVSQELIPWKAWKSSGRSNKI